MSFVPRRRRCGLFECCTKRNTKCQFPFKVISRWFEPCIILYVKCSHRNNTEKRFAEQLSLFIYPIAHWLLRWSTGSWLHSQRLWHLDRRSGQPQHQVQMLRRRDDQWRTFLPRVRHVARVHVVPAHDSVLPARVHAVTEEVANITEKVHSSRVLITCYQVPGTAI